MTTTNQPNHHDPKRRHARLHLPRMNADDALFVVAILEKAIAAIWRAHGDDMADRLAAAGVETPRPEGAHWAGDPTQQNFDF